MRPKADDVNPPSVFKSFPADPTRKLMLLKAFRNSPRSSRFIDSLNRTFFTMLKSVGKNGGPLSKRFAKPHSPPISGELRLGTCPKLCGQLPKPAGAINLPVGAPCVYSTVVVLGVLLGVLAGGVTIVTPRLCALTVFSRMSFGNT